MTPLGDTEVVARFRLAFEERTSGGIAWKRVAAEWIRENLEGWTTHAGDNVIYQYLADNGDIDQVAETREEYRFLHPYHYDFRIPVGGRQLYVETVLMEAAMGPIVTVVSIHDV